MSLERTVRFYGDKAFVPAVMFFPFFKAAFVDGNPTSIKYAMNFKGLPAGAVRLPLVEVTESAKKTIEAALKECNL